MTSKDERNMKYPRMFIRQVQSGYDPAVLRKKTVAIFGLGGIGALVVEMLARVGIGKLILVDKDVVEEENLNRVGYYPRDLGLPKVDVMYRRLIEFNKVRSGDFMLTVERYYVNVFLFDEINEVIKKADCVITAFDDVDARLEVNFFALKYNKILIDAGVSTNGLRGRVTVVKPFLWPCLGCYFSRDAIFSDNFEETSCNVSLASTMAITASLQVDFCLKALLNKEGIKPLVYINLEKEPKIIVYDNLRPRSDCPYCSRLRSNVKSKK